MSNRIPLAHNHWPLALGNEAERPVPGWFDELFGDASPFLAFPQLPPHWSPAGPRRSPQAENSRCRIARVLEVHLSTGPAWDLIRSAQACTFQVTTVADVIETATWITLRSRRA
ncbi:hypothetical protein [Streptomyces sp. 4F14]|uniref:hypothetical protein n=1 Tax=Streptomyces sp. 4F14 TaxID=3394380 RepID=UPI003A887697